MLIGFIKIYVSARKKIQPERLGPSSTVKSIKRNGKQNGWYKIICLRK